jgi:hypothetical protein
VTHLYILFKKSTESHALPPPKHLLSVPSAVAVPFLSTAVVPSAAAIIATPLSHRVTRLLAAATESSPPVCRHRILLPTTHLSSTTEAVICLLSSSGGPNYASAFIASHPPPSPSFIRRRHPLSSAIVSSRLPPLPYLAADWPLVCHHRTGHLLPLLFLPIVHRCCPLSSAAVTLSHTPSSPLVYRRCPILWLIGKSDHWSSTSCFCFRCLLSTAITLSHPMLPPLISSLLLPWPFLVADCRVLAPSGPRHALLDASAQVIWR